MPNEVKLLPCDRAIADALSDLKFGMDFAYEQGLHEFGYDPVETVRAALTRPTTVVTDEVVERLRDLLIETQDTIRDAANGDEPRFGDLWRKIESALASMPTVVTGELQGWQPIESAPKDGTWQVVAHFDDKCFYWWHRARFHRGHWRTGNGVVMPNNWMPLPAQPGDA